MKPLTLSLTLAATLAQGVVAQIVIKPVRTPNVATNRPGIIVPGPSGGAVEVAQKPQVIELLNGDGLRGTFMGFDSKGGTKWRHPAAKNEIVFEADSVSKIHLHPRQTKVPATQNCRVTLRSGEELLGELVALDDRMLTLSAWYSRNSLRIPRELVHSIAPGGQAAAVIYEGPNNLDGWIGANRQVGGLNPVPGRRQAQRLQINGRVIRGGLVPPGFGGNGWSFNKNAFHSRQSGAQIGRKLKYEDLTNVEFDLAWQRINFNLSVIVCADQVAQNRSSTGYLLSVSQYNCYLMRITSGGRTSNLGNGNLPNEYRNNTRTKARISIRIDKKNNTITLVMDNKVVKKWTDSNGFNGKGDTLSFVSQGTTPMRVSKIHVSRWDGKMPSAGGSGRKADQDLLRSGDSAISGTLNGIANGKVQFKSEFAPLNMPLENVVLLQLAGEEKAEKPVLGIGDVKVTLANGGDFIFRLDSWTADRVTGVSPLFGRVDFEPSAFAAVEFNLNKKRTGDDDDPFDF